MHGALERRQVLDHAGREVGDDVVCFFEVLDEAGTIGHDPIEDLHGLSLFLLEALPLDQCRDVGDHDEQALEVATSRDGRVRQRIVALADGHPRRKLVEADVEREDPHRGLVECDFEHLGRLGSMGSQVVGQAVPLGARPEPFLDDRGFLGGDHSVSVDHQKALVYVVQDQPHLAVSRVELPRSLVDDLLQPDDVVEEAPGDEARGDRLEHDESGMR